MTGWRSTLEKLDGVIERLEGGLLSASVLLMAASTIANVVARNGFGRSFSWAEEVSQMLSVLLTFVGVGHATRRARHIRMSAFYELFPARWRKRLWVAVCLATSTLLLLLAGCAVDYVASVRALGSVTPALRIPLYLVYAWAPLGLCLGAFQYALTALRNILEPGLYASYYLEERPEPPLGTS